MDASTLTVRDAVEADHPRFSELFVELGVPEAPPSLDDYVERHMPLAFFVCDVQGRAVGYGLGRVAGPRWYVSNVVTAPEARRRGVGRAIMAEHARRARAHGLTQWALNVKRDNVAALALYEALGMSIAARSWAFGISWDDVSRLAPSDAHTTPAPSPDHDLAIEAAFSLAAGTISSERQRPGRDLVVLWGGGAPVAFASFDPSFPGASPFKVRETRWARALFEAIRPLARPEHTHVRLTVEGDERLAEALTEAGARTHFELYSMRGLVP